MFWGTLIFAFLAVGACAVKLELSGAARDKIKETLTEVCKKAGAEDKAEQVTNSVQAFLDCVSPLVDPNTLKSEIEEARPNGTLDEVFNKYCAKTPQFKTCLHTLIDAANPCVEDSSKNYLTLAKNGTDQLIDFVCYKGGDRIAMFIAEAGPECFQEKSTAIKACAETLKSQVSSVENAQSLTLAEKCGKFDELLTCIVKALDTCSTPTPANMVESVFRYVRKGSACNDALPRNNN